MPVGLCARKASGQSCAPCASAVAPAKTARGVLPPADRPENEARLSHNLFLREIPPGTSVVAVHCVVSKSEIMTRAHNEFARFLRKQRSQIHVGQVLPADDSIDVPGKMIFFGRFFWVKSVNVLKPRR